VRACVRACVRERFCAYTSKHAYVISSQHTRTHSHAHLCSHPPSPLSPHILTQQSEAAQEAMHKGERQKDEGTLASSSSLSSSSSSSLPPSSLSAGSAGVEREVDMVGPWGLLESLLTPRENALQVFTCIYTYLYVYIHVDVYIYMCIFVCMYPCIYVSMSEVIGPWGYSGMCVYRYGVATISGLLKIIGLFCKRALQKRRYSAKET